MPAGVQGSGPGAPMTRRPRLVGCRPSTSFVGTNAQQDLFFVDAHRAGAAVPKSSGRSSSALNRSTTASISACVALGGQVHVEGPHTDLRALFDLHLHVARAGRVLAHQQRPEPRRAPHTPRDARTRSAQLHLDLPGESVSPSSSTALMVLLVAKVTLSGEHHDDSGRVGGLNDFVDRVPILRAAPPT